MDLIGGSCRHPRGDKPGAAFTYDLHRQSAGIARVLRFVGSHYLINHGLQFRLHGRIFVGCVLDGVLCTSHQYEHKTTQREKGNGFHSVEDFPKFTINTVSGINRIFNFLYTVKRKDEDTPGSIKYYVKRYLLAHSADYAGKKVVDFPAGNGITSRILASIGANPVPMDLFPEYFEVEGMSCTRANIREGLPLASNSADAVICQEGIEHFSDQFSALKEFNRILKPSGTLLITTPNYSSLRGKLSYLLSESERHTFLMPPNELDSVWMSNQAITEEIYFGHIFLTGIQKLRVLAKLTGFRIKKCHFTRARSTSVILFPLFYPWILLSNWIAYRRNMRKNKDYDPAEKKAVYREQFHLSVDPKILTGGTLMVEFIKEQEVEQVSTHLRGKHTGFGTT